MGLDSQRASADDRDMPSPEDQMVKAVGPLWSTPRALGALGLTETEAAQWRDAGWLLGVPSSDGDIFYPLWQFETHGGRVRVRPALAAFLAVLRDQDPWTVAMVATTPAEELRMSPAEWTRNGRDAETLLNFANLLRSEWSP